MNELINLDRDAIDLLPVYSWSFTRAGGEDAAAVPSNSAQFLVLINYYF